jgi:peptide/nickel transport system substrate-binding protein
MNETARERLVRTRKIAVLERVNSWVESLSAGDRIIFYILAGLLCVTSLWSLYTLEQSLLVVIPTYGGTLVEGDVGSPRFINPLLAISDADNDLSTLTYAGLMGLSGNGSLVPVLAENYVVSPDDKTYTFTIRPNAKFSDGTPVTANDVVFTVQKAQDSALKSPQYANWSGVQVTALDSRTVQFTLAKPYAPFLGLTTLGILPASLWANVSDEEFPFSSLEANPVGAGPFKVVGIARDSSGLIQSVSLAANPDYVLGRPYLDGIRFVFYPGTEDVATALANGSIDSAYDVSQPGALTAPYSRVFGVFWNPTENSVYADPNVRKALSLAVDRQAIVNNVLDGYATPIMGPVPPGSLVHQVPIPNEPNPTAAAASVLEAGGWTYDGSAAVWKNASTNEALTGITLRTSNVPELMAVASAVQADWQNLGIPVDIELYEPGDLSQNVIRPRKYDALLYGEVIGRDQDLYAFWDSQEINDPGLNIAMYSNKTVDGLLDDARSTGNSTEQTSDLQQIENDVAADYPAAFLYAPDFTYAVPKDLRGVELPQIIVPADRFANVASWYLMTDSVWPFFVNKDR